PGYGGQARLVEAVSAPRAGPTAAVTAVAEQAAASRMATKPCANFPMLNIVDLPEFRRRCFGLCLPLNKSRAKWQQWQKTAIFSRWRLPTRCLYLPSVGKMSQHLAMERSTQLVGQSSSFLDAVERASRAAPLDRPVLVIG